MSFKHGKDTKIEIDDTGGTLRDLSPYITSSENPFERDLADVTTHGNAGHRFFPGLFKGSFSVQGLYDPTVTTGPDAVLGGLAMGQTATSTISWMPGGTAVGQVKYAAEYWLKSYKGSARADGMVEFSAEFEMDGVPARTVF